MKPRTICHPEALADWRANDERPQQQQVNGETNVNHNTLPKKQSKLKGLLAQRLEEAIERENRKCRKVRKEREA